MGVDYAIVIGVGACFSDAFLRLVSRDVQDKFADATNDGHTVFVETLYKETSLQMHCGDVAPYPVLPPTTLTHDEIVERALDALGIKDVERSVVSHILSLEKDYVKTGMYMLHYAW
jgi:hypothetical protein